MHKNVFFFICFCFLFDAPASGKVLYGIDIDQVMNDSSAPKELAIISKLQPSDQSNMVLDKNSKLADMSFLHLSDKQSIDWSFKVNRFQESENAAPDLELTKKRFFFLSDADMIVLAPTLAGGFNLLKGKSPWQLLLKGKKDPLVFDAPKGNSEEDILNGVFNALGYNGVVVKSDSSTVYIASHVFVLKSGAQGIVFKGSRAHTILPAQSSDASALLQFTESKDYVGKFEIILGSSDGISVGDKVFVTL